MNLLNGRWRIGAAALALLLESCRVFVPNADVATATPGPAAKLAAPSPPASGDEAPPANGPITVTPSQSAGPLVRQNGNGATIGRPAAPSPRIDGNGDVTLNYVDTDIREIARVVLGDVLHVNYSIDPRFQGLATIQTARPLRREEVLPAFETVLEQTGGSMVLENGIYRITAVGNTTIVPSVVSSANATEGSQIVSLRYASAKQLAAMLTPYVGEGARIFADPARNVLIVNGPPDGRQNLIDLIHVFDVDYLAGQSYAIFPVKSGEPEKVAEDLDHALQIDADGPLAGAIRVVPLIQANAIMVIAQQRAYLDRAAHLIAQLDEVAQNAGRNLHVIYLRNAQAVDLQPVLQTAFNPPRAGGGENGGAPGSLPPTAVPMQMAAPAATGAPPTGAASTAASPGSSGSTANSAAPSAYQSAAQSSAAAATVSPAPASVAAAPGAPQIIANAKGNALLVVSTEDEYTKIEAAVRRLDVMPAQVLVEATIAEVTLNKALQYGTQFFFNNSTAALTLTNAQSATPLTLNPASPLSNAQAFTNTLAPNFPGFAVTRAVGSVQYALQALESVTDVRVISAPKILILDQQKASIQVGSLVPVITQSATSVTTAGAPVVNSVDYHPTGIILNVTPHIGSSGLVTLDIEQEVSSVVATTSSTIDSPTFNERLVKSRVVVQDGATIGLAGLISDNKSIGNSGIPILRNIPVLGPLFSTQNNSDIRTELLVLITPRVVHDQREARGMTEELERKLAPPARLAP